VFVLVGIALLLLLPSPWNWAAFAACLVLFLGEVAFWHRRVRGNRSVVGGQTLIGATGTVVSPCRPRGQVRVGGEIWAARCDDGADRGAEVTVVGLDDLTLTVVHANRPA
jgi:membrane protein implicated in regulation of membrane protease activity